MTDLETKLEDARLRIQLLERALRAILDEPTFHDPDLALHFIREYAKAALDLTPPR